MATEQAKPLYIGTCALCNAQVPRRSMGRHLQKCIAEHAPERDATGRRRPPVRLFHLFVEDRYGRDYWLHLEASATATLRHLDQYLRDIWLECCGHLSQFTIAGVDYVSFDPKDREMPFFGRREERSMDVRLDRVLEVGTKFEHEYDFGSTTELALRVLSERTGPRLDKDDIVLLARNDPLDLRCAICSKPATVLCTNCVWEQGGDAFYCDDCRDQHKCGEDYFLPVVNSPRMGVCGYTG